MISHSLPPSAGELILASRPSFAGFTRVDEIRFVACGIHDLLYVAVGIVDTSFRKDIIHTSYILKREPGATDWSNAILYKDKPSSLCPESNILDCAWEEMEPLLERITPSGEKAIMRGLPKKPRE